MKELTCNFAIARFRPYRETGEFVNVGMVLVCPQLGFFGHIFEHRKHKRITDFFPELDVEIFKAGLSATRKELSRLSSPSAKSHNQFVLGAEAQLRLGAFKQLVRPRESLFSFGQVGSVLATDPEAKLHELFNFYIKRQFAREREYQEIIMRRRLAEFLEKENLARFYKQDQPLGDDSYRIVLPFVHYVDNTPRKAIKPLHLDKESPTDIYRHGDAWIASVRRLRGAGHLPDKLLFAVKSPTGRTKQKDAAEQICHDLKSLDTLIIPYSDTRAILDFARI